MSSGAGLSSQPVPKDPPRACARPIVPWCWPRGARLLLAGLVIVAGLGLALAGRGDPSEGEQMARPPELILDPNKAPLKALAALPHIGPALAQRLVEARALRPFSSLEDLQARVRGVGPVTLARLETYLRIDTELSPGNRADARSDRPGEPPPAPRRKLARARRPGSTPRQPRPDFTVADRS